MSRCRMDAYRQAKRIHEPMQFGGQPATRAADGGSFSPSFAPVASAWTFETVLSVRTYPKSGMSAKAWKSLSHTPACDQRRNLA